MHSLMTNETQQNWLLIELGGSSAQTAERVGNDFRFSTGIVRAADRPVALACPGLIREEHVLYATNLGWPDDADPRVELNLPSIAILVNDADATALGESVLRDGGQPTVDLGYIGLGSGVGSTAVRNGAAVEWNLGHCQIGGDAYCDGCRAHGCLNAYLAANKLPNPLSEADQQFVAQTLMRGLERTDASDDLMLVIGGGIGRRYSGIAKNLAALVPNRVEGSIAPLEAKSAAYAGLDYLARNWRAL